MLADFQREHHSFPQNLVHKLQWQPNQLFGIAADHLYGWRKLMPQVSLGSTNSRERTSQLSSPDTLGAG